MKMHRKLHRDIFRYGRSFFLFYPNNFLSDYGERLRSYLYWCRIGTD